MYLQLDYIGINPYLAPVVHLIKTGNSIKTNK